MFDAHTASDVLDAATPLGLEILDELCVTLLECLLVAKAAEDEAGLNLDELLEALSAAQHPARSAFRAASLLHQGAALAESWSANNSRPKAVFARHYAAVRNGAPRSSPVEPTCARLERALNATAHLDCAQNVDGERPRCEAWVAKSGNDCKNSAVYLGADRFAQHCYAHMTPAERQSFKSHQTELALARHATNLGRAEQLSKATDLVISEWIHRRDNAPRWLDDDLRCH